MKSTLTQYSGGGGGGGGGGGVSYLEKSPYFRVAQSVLFRGVSLFQGFTNMVLGEVESVLIREVYILISGVSK